MRGNIATEHKDLWLLCIKLSINGNFAAMHGNLDLIGCYHGSLRANLPSAVSSMQWSLGKEVVSSLLNNSSMSNEIHITSTTKRALACLHPCLNCHCLESRPLVQTTSGQNVSLSISREISLVLAYNFYDVRKGLVCTISTIPV